MRKLLSLSAVALLAVFASAQDDGAFPDTPANHWAYEALASMKAQGLLVGYPDGLFRGPRPASRYEMAVAMHDVYTNLKNQIDGMQSLLDRSKAINPQDITYLQSQVEALKSDVAALKQLGPDIQNLQHAAETFEIELEQLGVDVEAMKTDMGKLASRVGALEKKKPPIDISGRTDFWLGAGDSRDGFLGLDKDGRVNGTAVAGPISSFNPPVPGAVGLIQDSNIIHEAAFTVASTNANGPKWDGTIVVSDAFGYERAATPLIGFGNQSDMFNPAYGSANIVESGILGYSSGQEDIYLQSGGITVGGPKADIELGRIGYSLGPYMFQRLDNSSYYSNPRWDNGEYYYDGILGKLALGPATFHIFGGRNSGLTSADGVELNPLRTGPIDGPFSGGPHVASGDRLDIDRSLGFDLELGTSRIGKIDAAYTFMDGETETPVNPGQNANRLGVYGTDGLLHVGPVDLTGGYHRTEVSDNNTPVIGSDNSAMNLGISAKHGSYNLYANWREVQANYLAPGDWGRLGVLRDPTNIKGFQFGAAVGLTKQFKLTANTEFDTGITDNYGLSTFLGSSTKITMYQVRLDYKAKKNLDLYGGWESTRFGDLSNSQGIFVGPGDPLYRWTTFGMECRISSRTKFTLQYELSDVDNDYQVTNGSNFRGGLLTSQLTFEF